MSKFWDLLRSKNLPTLEKGSNKDHELYGTYITITPDMGIDELMAIQDWAKGHPALIYRSMPISDVLDKAKRNGKAYVCIDDSGQFFDNRGPHCDWRKLTLNLRPAVSYYKVEPKTILVNGKHYDKKELEEALESLTPKNM